MSKGMLASTIACFGLGCGPEAADDEDDPLGRLRYEHSGAEFYQLERRVEVVSLDPILSPEGCGFLTDRAYYDLVTTIDALDPALDYEPALESCQDGVVVPNGFVHLEDFEHSPFDCGWNCCHPDLLRIALVYFMVESNLVDQEPVVDGVPYVAIEPDRPCP